MKYLNNILVLFVLLFSISFSTIIAANTMVVQCPASVSGVKDATFDVYVGVNSVSNLFGTSFVLNYDKVNLSAQLVSLETFLGTDLVYFSNIDNAAGKVSVGMVKKAGQQAVSGTGNLVKVTFKILNNVSTQVTCPFTLTEIAATNELGNSIILAAQNGSTILTPVQAGPYAITTSSSPVDGGTTSGGGSFSAGQSVSVKAVANNGYVFIAWKENNITVSTNSIYTFSATANRALVAVFQPTTNNAVLMIGNASAAVNDSVLIPISALNLKGVCAITIRIQFDPTVLSFGRAVNFDSQISDALAGAANGVVSIVWDAINGVNFTANKLCDLKFLYKGSAAPSFVTFITATTEIADGSGNVFPVTFVNGYVTAGVGVKGQVTYANTAKTPLTGVKVFLSNATAVLDSVVTDSNGNYSFDGKSNGTYFLRCSHAGSWGGVNSTDALFVRQYIASIRVFDSLQVKAADVNLSNSVSSVDALMMRKRIANPDSLFKAGDWVFEYPSVVVNGSTVTQNIRALCTGDVNQSYSPVVAKVSSAVQFGQVGAYTVNSSGIIDVPVFIDRNIEVSAITLIINYPKKQYEVVGIESRIKELSSTIANGVISIAWDDLVPVFLKSNEAIITLKLKSKKDYSYLTGFSYNSSSEFADSKGNVVNNLVLSMPVINNTKPAGFDLQQNYPNPFNPVTTINYSVSVQSNVKLIVFNTLGETVKTLNSGIVEEGFHNVIFDASNLSSGIYYYSLTAEAVNGKGIYKSVKKLLLLK